MPLNLRKTLHLLRLTPADLPSSRPNPFPFALVIDLSGANEMPAEMPDYLRPAAARAPLILAISRERIREAAMATLIGDLRPDAVMLAGCRSVADPQSLDAALRVIEAKHALADRDIAIVAELGGEPEIFIATSLTDASPRLAALVFNADALAGRLGGEAGDGTALPVGHARAQALLMAAAAGMPAFDMLTRRTANAMDIVERLDAARRDGFAGVIVPGVADADLIFTFLTSGTS